MNNAEFSSNVNEVIRAVLNSSFFYEKISHPQKAHKAQKAQKVQKSTKGTTGTKSTKKHKMQISE